jgi:hypothetical protein
MVRRHFPHLKIHARARNRRHALELKALGVDYVMRETWLSSLDMAREALATVGVRKPERYVEMFRRHDEEVLDEQVQFKDDLEALAKIDRRSRDELVELFEDDRTIIEINEPTSHEDPLLDPVPEPLPDPESQPGSGTRPGSKTPKKPRRKANESSPRESS